MHEVEAVIGGVRATFNGMSLQSAPLALRVPSALSPVGRDEGVRQLLARFRGVRGDLIAAFRSAPAVADLARSLDPKKMYEIEWPAGMLEAVQNGDTTWKKYADGSLAVVLRDKDGKSIVKHLRLRESDVPFQSAAAMSNLAIQAALADVVARLEEIDAKLERSLAGARADRHGIVDGGIHLYEQAVVLVHPADRRRLLLSAAQTLAEGRGQLLKFIEAEAAAIQPPTALSGFFKAVPFAETPTQKYVKRMTQLTEDAGKAIVATRAIVLVYEELGETESARVAVMQLADAGRGNAARLATLARSVPATVNLPMPEHAWQLLDQKVIPAADRSVGVLAARNALPLIMDVEARELCSPESTNA